jgi:hypothetical protein
MCHLFWDKRFKTATGVFQLNYLELSCLQTRPLTLNCDHDEQEQLVVKAKLNHTDTCKVNPNHIYLYIYYGVPYEKYICPATAP